MVHNIANHWPQRHNPHLCQTMPFGSHFCQTKLFGCVQLSNNDPQYNRQLQQGASCRPHISESRNCWRKQWFVSYTLCFIIISDSLLLGPTFYTLRNRFIKKNIAYPVGASTCGHVLFEVTVVISYLITCLQSCAVVSSTIFHKTLYNSSFFSGPEWINGLGSWIT